MGLQLSGEKTSIPNWNKPIAFLGYHIHGELRKTAYKSEPSSPYLKRKKD